MTAYTIYQAAAMPVTQWAGGSTRQLAIFPAKASVAAQDFQWRFSSAAVLQDGPFTAFPKHQRLLALRQGAGFVLQVDAQQQIVHSRQQLVRFAGQAKSQAKLLDGEVVDINLMFNQSLQAQLWSQHCSSAAEPLLRPIPTTATLLIYADTTALEIGLTSLECPITLAQGNVLQLHPPVSQCWFRALPDEKAGSVDAADASSVATNLLTSNTAVFAWLAPVT